MPKKSHVLSLHTDCNRVLSAHRCLTIWELLGGSETQSFTSGRDLVSGNGDHTVKRAERALDSRCDWLALLVGLRPIAQQSASKKLWWHFRD